MASTNPGNFANNREKAAEAGRKGGKISKGNFAYDREKAVEAGRKGGLHRKKAPAESPA